MNKISSKVFYGALSILFATNIAFGIDAEFKNSLMKVDVIKTAEGNYNIDLYTKNKFLEPVKVIKKSDLNYYILLPETKNESTRNSTQGTDIRSISTNVYKYAGSDVQNGYVKIDINTTKPLNFRVNVKNVAPLDETVNKSSKVLALKENKSNKEIDSTLVQKKNSLSSTSKIVKKEAASNTESNEPKLTIEQAVQEEIQRIREENQDLIDEEFEASLNEELGLNESNIVSKDLEEIQQIAGEGDSNKSFIASLKSKISSKLTQLGIKKRDFLIAVYALFITFILTLFVLIKNALKKRPAKKIELSRKEICTCAPEENTEIKNDGQYFVFDKNIKQTGFCDPATSAIKRNYELSTYEPELKNKYTRNVQFNKKTNSEYDIIQKILKEDSFIDIPAETIIPEKQIQTKTSKPIESVPVKKIKQQSEPTVLSSVEIAPQRGFMCVSYNDNISLLGYIFDDVFALYNFKAIKLENYEIKYRLSEKDDKSASFIVKVSDVKMLINVTKTKMTMEVLL